MTQLARPQRESCKRSHTHLGISLMCVLGLVACALAPGAQADPTPRAIIDSTGDRLGDTMTASGLGDCEDGVDNDGDGRTDFPDDPGCTSLADASEREAGHICDDGVDNDGDTFIDFPNDPGCARIGDTSELGHTDCDDGVDNDTDGFTDFPDDPNCSGPADRSEVPDCSDGLDNDFDGLVDFPDDPGCVSLVDENEREAGLACDDGIDNDGDGRVDYAFSGFGTPMDRGCRGPADPSERSADLPCDDGVDNDGDTFADYPDDPDCVSPVWPFESASPIAIGCSDGIDNDGDGQVDWPDDAGCTSAEDEFERSNLITMSGGVITGFLCETNSADCENDANFSVTSAVVGAGQMLGGAGNNSKSFSFPSFDVPQISFEGSSGAVARVELTDVMLDGFWIAPFLGNPNPPFAFLTTLAGTIETFDAVDASISGPTAFSLQTDDRGSLIFGNLLGSVISHCTATAVETGQCTLFLDSFVGGQNTLDIAGTPHRLVWKFDSVALAATCGNGVIDPGEECDDGNEVSGDCCSSICEAEPDGGPCDDALFCNGADTCGGGVCLHTGDPCPGPDGDASCAESCDEAADACTAADPDGSSCTDANACTTPDTCASGNCTAGAPLVCNDANGCTDDSCNPVSGCSFVDNNLPCDDAVFCNGADTCSSGACLTHTGDPCPGPDGDGSCAESCDEGADACTAADPDGSSCTDGNTCTESDLCASGSCASGPPLDCDDADLCTADSCDEFAGCAHDPIAGCPPPVPTGSNAMWLLTAVTLLGFGLWRLAHAVRGPLT